MAKYCSILDENEGDGHCSNIALEGNILCSKHLIEELRTLTLHHYKTHKHLKKKIKELEDELEVQKDLVFDLQKQVVPELSEKVKCLEKDNFHLSAYQCLHKEMIDVEEGIDAPFCTLKRNYNSLKKRYEALLKELPVTR